MCIETIVHRSATQFITNLFVCCGQFFGLLSSSSDTFPWVGCGQVGTVVQNCIQPVCGEIVWGQIEEVPNNVGEVLY